MVGDPFELNIVADVQGQVFQTSQGDQQHASSGAKPAAKLKALMEISQALANASAVEDILPQVLSTVLRDVFPFADRGSILLLDPRTGAMIPTAQQRKSRDGQVTVKLSRTLLNLVMKEKQGVRSVDAGQDERFARSASIALSQVHSMMCVPMLNLEGDPIGIIHVDSHSTFATFSADDMDLLGAIASQAALSYDSAVQMQKREQLRAEMEIARHRALSQMVSGLAHELNTPLGIINTAACVLREAVSDEEVLNSSLSEDARETLDDAVEAATLLQSNLTRANHLISDFKKLSTRQFADTRETVAIGELLDEVVQVVATQRQHAGRQLLFSNHLNQPAATWEGFPGHLTQVLISLLDNAAEHGYPQGGGRLEVHLSEQPLADPPAYCVQVRDYGVGIPPADHQQVFVPFFTTARSRGHRGLGLAIVYTIVNDSLRGTVSLQAAPGHGSIFSVMVPRAVPAPEAT